MTSLAEASPNDPARVLGKVVAEHYRVHAWLGTGSMSAVYEVEDLRNQVRAAMKVLLPALGADKQIAARFVREAKAMSMFDHRNIVDVCDLGRFEDGTLFLVSDIVRGVSLRALIEDGFVAPNRGLSIMRQVLEALGHAHAVGVIHRDVKPENIMLVDGGSPDGETDLVKVLDFGVAKLLGDAMSVLGERNLTQTGFNLLGTPMYMAPEPILGRPIDARTDLYSVGAVLFELLTGRPPFTGAEPAALMRCHAKTLAPTLAEAAPDRIFTPELEYLVGDALAKKPEHRFKSAAEMITALDAGVRSLEPLDLPSPPPDVRTATSVAATKGNNTIHSLVPPVGSARQPSQLPPIHPAPTRATEPASTSIPFSSPPVSHRSAASPQLSSLHHGSPAPFVPSHGSPMPPDRACPPPWATAVRRHKTVLLVAGGFAFLTLVVALAARGAGQTTPKAISPAAASASEQPTRASGPALAPIDYLEQGHAAIKRGRRADALAAYERAIAITPDAASDVRLRSNTLAVLDTRDAVAAVIALELLASRVEPPAHDRIIAQASNGKIAEIRHRAFAIAERDGFDDRVDRIESWSLDLRQATTCDDRKVAIAKLRARGDRRALAILEKTRTRHACIERDAAEAIAHLEIESRP